MQALIIGHTGIVGQTLIDIMIKKNDIPRILYLTSPRDSTTEVPIRPEISVISFQESLQLTDLDIIYMCVPAEIVEKHYQEYLQKNDRVKIVDNSSYFRRNDNVKILISPINGYLLFLPTKLRSERIFANSNCTTAGLLMALFRVHQQYTLTRVRVVSFQSVSGSGYAGMDQLTHERQGDFTCKCYPTEIHDNVIPMIGTCEENISEEESKIIFETKKVLDDDKIDVYATCVRCPVMYCHSMAVEFSLQKYATLNMVRDTMVMPQHVIVTDEIVTHQYVRQKEEVFVSRLRKHNDNFFCFITFDNLYRGASLNSYEIGRMLQIVR